MRWINKRVLFSTFMVVAAACALTCAHMQTANAAGTFDYGVITTNTGNLGGGTTCTQSLGSVINANNPFITNTPQYWKNAGYIDNSAFLTQMETDYNNNKGTGSGWGAYYMDGSYTGNDGGSIIFMQFDPSTVFTVTPYMVGGSPYPQNYWLNADHPIQMVTMGLNPNAGCRYQLSTSSSSRIAMGSPNYKWLYLATNNITYPSDMSNSPIPGSLTPPTPPNTSQPNWSISNIINFKAHFSDSNFATTDQTYPVLCDDNTAPVLHTQLFSLDSSNNATKLQEWTTSATAQFDYDFGSSNATRNYRILGWYDCGASDSHQFINNGQLEFKVNPQGTQQFDLFTSCVSQNFPFIDVQGCMSNLQTVFSYMVFNQIQMPNWSFDGSCHQLTTFNDWLHLQNNNGYVCPQIPAAVRNVVTPFVGFMLGIVTIGILRRRGGDFNG